MCINPASHEGKTFGCRKCWQCRENRIQDLVGRCIAQSKTSTCTRAVTLTYGGGDHERATILTYSDVQKFFKRLRKQGFSFKYLVCGENGSKKGRSHWHAILFFDGKAPEHTLRERFDFDTWGHGHTYWDEPNPRAVRYVCKYVLKAEDDDAAQAMLRMSKKPPIGFEYFDGLAREYAKARLAPPTLEYRFADNRDKEGKAVRHFMHGATARNFLAAFVHYAGAELGDATFPTSEVVSDFLDSLVNEAPDPYLDKRRYGVAPFFKPHELCELEFDQMRNTFTTYYYEALYVWRPLDPFNPRTHWAWLSEAKPRTAITATSRGVSPHPKWPATPEWMKRDEPLPPAQALQHNGAKASDYLLQSLSSGKSRLPMVGDLPSIWSSARRNRSA